MLLDVFYSYFLKQCEVNSTLHAIINAIPINDTKDVTFNTVTYADLLQSVDRLTACIEGRVEVVIGVCLPHGSALYSSILTCFKLNKIYLPICVTYTKNRINFILKGM